MHFHHDPIVLRQLPYIAQIIRDETKQESERRGHPVSPHDPAVRANVCAAVLRVGAELRARLSRPDQSADPATPRCAA